MFIANLLGSRIIQKASFGHVCVGSLIQGYSGHVERGYLVKKGGKCHSKDRQHHSMGWVPECKKERTEHELQLWTQKIRRFTLLMP